MIAKCSCQHCGGGIEFDADGFQADTRIECPHCKLDTILFLQPTQQKPEPPKNFTDARKPEPAPKVSPQRHDSNRLQTFFTFLNFTATTTAAFFLFLVLHQQKTPVEWKYEEFQYGHSDSYMAITYYDSEPTTSDPFNLVKSDPRRVISADETLSVLGRDGWQLAWTDGTRYLMKRSQGKWAHHSFSVFSVGNSKP